MRLELDSSSGTRVARVSRRSGAKSPPGGSPCARSSRSSRILMYDAAAWLYSDLPWYRKRCAASSHPYRTSRSEAPGQGRRVC